ncbi:MAG: radical SAM protein, partial [bacterium]|nr:radical SAM protein [bacterium]
TSYARSKSAEKKSLEELKALHEAGLSRLHIGMESGNDEVLAFMQKGVNQEQHISGGQKVVAAGISLSEYIMPGLGGKRWSQVHALDSARALSEINPDFIRLRSLIVRRNSILYDKYLAGEFEPLSEDEFVDEIALFIENLDCDSYVVSDQMSNLLFEVEGQFPQDKERVLREINHYRQKQPLEKLKFRLNRRLRSYLAVYGGLSPEMDRKVSEALESIAKEAPEAESKTNQAISALKDGFV